MPVGNNLLKLDPADETVDAAITELAAIAKTTAENVRKKVETWAHELGALPHHLLAMILLTAKSGAEDLFADQPEAAGSH